MSSNNEELIQRTENSMGSVPSFTQITMPAFTMELYNVGGSTHTETSTTLTGYPKASGYILNEDEMGFKADGAFTHPAWSYASTSND